MQYNIVYDLKTERNINMKIKDGFILREVGSQTVVVAVGEQSKKFNGIINLNGTGKFMWEKLAKGCDEEKLIGDILKEYDVDEATAKKDVSDFVDKLRRADILE
jgi:hypothetical protein